MLLFSSAFSFWSGISFSVVWDNLLILLFFSSYLFQSLLLTNLHRSHPLLMPPLLHTWGFVSRSSIPLHWSARNFLPVPHDSNDCDFIILDISFKCPFEEPMPNTWLRYIWPKKLLPHTGSFPHHALLRTTICKARKHPGAQFPGKGQRMRTKKRCINSKGH